jgi:hypothetical protein
MTITSATQSGIECPRCKEVIFSNSRHDFVECNCGACYIDGGFDYNRQGFDPDVGPGIPINRTVVFPLGYYFRDGQPRRAWSDRQVDSWKKENGKSDLSN